MCFCERLVFSLSQWQLRKLRDSSVSRLSLVSTLFAYEIEQIIKDTFYLSDLLLQLLLLDGVFAATCRLQLHTKHSCMFHEHKCTMKNSTFLSVHRAVVLSCPIKAEIISERTGFTYYLSRFNVCTTTAALTAPLVTRWHPSTVWGRFIQPAPQRGRLFGCWFAAQSWTTYSSRPPADACCDECEAACLNHSSPAC